MPPQLKIDVHIGKVNRVIRTGVMFLSRMNPMMMRTAPRHPKLLRCSVSILTKKIGMKVNRAQTMKETLPMKKNKQELVLEVHRTVFVLTGGLPVSASTLC